MAALPSINVDVSYSDQKDKIKNFLIDFKTKITPEINENQNEINQMEMDQESSTYSKYLDLLQKVANRETNTFLVELDDIVKWANNNDFVTEIMNNTLRYNDLFSVVIDELMPEPTIEISYEDEVLDVILAQRRQRNENIAQEEGIQSPEDLFPPDLTRRYYVYFKPLTESFTNNSSNDSSNNSSNNLPVNNSNNTSKGLLKPMSIRQVHGNNVGHLITVRGIVTRVSDVKPCLQITAYTCDKCGCEIFQEVKTKQFTPLTQCPSQECQKNNSKGQLYMSTRASKFISFQDVKIQEMSDQVPIGHIPRTMTIYLCGPIVRSVKPGDYVDIAGILLPTSYTGYRAIRAGLITDIYLQAQYIVQHKIQYDSIECSEAVLNEIEHIRSQGNVFTHLAMSIAPEIYGHLDVKKILLLLLIGGVTKETRDGMRIRGDINVCLMGDPGVAKSQLLKYITKIAPRGVYTTGRGSSGVGLTAAVMRDPVTDEMVLEGGALVLADNGICCIDEFDKMDESDRTAIHEVMEQQTISISKAGITTTLNARTSILAAANPIFGRYNTKLSPIHNINLPAALLSRFDIMYLILDKPSRDNDERLAEHVTYVHMHNHQPREEYEPLSANLLRQYISISRQFRPTIPSDVGEYMVGAYVQMRKKAKEEKGSKKEFTHATPRSLLAVLRLSQALARLRFDTKVISADVDEALRLVEVSRASLYADDKTESYDTTVDSKIYNIITKMARTEKGMRSLDMDNVRSQVTHRGFTGDQLEQMLSEYSELGIIQISQEKLHFVGSNIDSDSEDEEDIAIAS